MLKLRDLKAVETGPRQMTLGLEPLPPETLEDICLTVFREMIPIRDPVVLDELMIVVQEKHLFSEADILQAVFRLAADHKLHFRIDGRPVSPVETRRILIQFPDKTVVLADNQQASDAVFSAALKFFQDLLPDTVTGFNPDQYEFSMALRSLFKRWEADLLSLKQAARRPFFPGGPAVERHLSALKILLLCRSTRSIIGSALEHRQRIAEIHSDLGLLSDFYRRHAGFWETLIQYAEDLQGFYKELEAVPEAWQAFQTLLDILASPAPWDRISAAQTLQNVLDPHRERILHEKVQKRREQAQVQINRWIEDVTGFLDSRHAGLDDRNRCLYPLKTGLEKIMNLTSVQDIDAFLIHLEDGLLSIPDFE